MSEILKKEFTELLFNTAENCTENALLTALFPIQGNKYKANRDLMVVGRALNTWGSKEENIWWDKDKNKITLQKAKNIINFSKEINGKCSMKWIVDHWRKHSVDSIKDGYYMNKSAFWRVTKSILKELRIIELDVDWSSYVVWTDLYKVSYQKGRNPSSGLMNSQFDDCLSFFKKEIEHFKPKRILFLCGYDWFKDFETAGFIGRRFWTNVEWIGKFGKSKVVVARHPQGLDESKFVKQVKNAFARF